MNLNYKSGIHTKVLLVTKMFENLQIIYFSTNVTLNIKTEILINIINFNIILLPIFYI